MGILLSVLKCWGYETDKDENGISTHNCDHKGFASSHHKWQDGNKSILSRDLKYPTISVPKSSANQNTPQNGKQRGITIKCNVVSAEGRWIKHYSSCHRILVVGDGDFSFSTCLAATFGWASNIIATSRDSQSMISYRVIRINCKSAPKTENALLHCWTIIAFLVKNYHKALSNLAELSIRGCKVMHDIDATKMCTHPYLGGIKFDRVVFNFPYAGLFKGISRDSQLRLHRKLVSQFLMNAKEMINENGEIHISHKTNGFHAEFKLESIASSHKLRLVEAVDFNHLEYPGYNTKYGFGGDNNFNCYPSKTYKFGLRF